MRIYRERQFYRDIQQQLGVISKKIEYYDGDMNDGRFVPAIQISRQGMMRAYNSSEMFLGVIAAAEEGGFPFQVRVERIKTKVHISFGPRDYSAFRLTGAIDFGEGEHVLCDYYNELSWEHTSNVRELSHSRKRNEPNRDLCKCPEKDKHIRELSIEMNDQSKERVKSMLYRNKLISGGLIDKKESTARINQVNDLVNSGHDVQAFLLMDARETRHARFVHDKAGLKKATDEEINATQVHEAKRAVVVQFGTNPNPECHLYRSAQAELLEAEETLANKTDAKESWEKKLKKSEKNLKVEDEVHVLELAASKWNDEHQQKKNQLHNFVLTMCFEKLSGRRPGTLYHTGGNRYDVVSNALATSNQAVKRPSDQAAQNQPRKSKKHKTTPKMCQYPGCSSQARAESQRVWCMKHNPNKIMCKSCGKSKARVGGICKKCRARGEAPTVSFCVECLVRPTPKRNIRCSDCSSYSTCSQCFRKGAKYAGRLCKHCKYD